MTFSVLRSPAEAVQIIVEELQLLFATPRDRALDVCAARIAQLIAERDAAQQVATAADLAARSVSELYVTIGVMRRGLRTAAELLEASHPDAAKVLRTLAGAP